MTWMLSLEGRTDDRATISCRSARGTKGPAGAGSFRGR
jgi:hypothetical protein